MPDTRIALRAEIKGLQEFRWDLRRAGDAMANIDMTVIAQQGGRLAAAYAPRRTGRLAASIRTSKGRGAAWIKAGKTAVPYAAVINYGWKKRNIQPSLFLDRAAQVLRRTAPRDVEREVIKLIRHLRGGLG